MSSYLATAYAAVLSFPFTAALCTLPYIIYQYRKYGSIPFWKTFTVFMFIFYAVAAYYLVILPLPEDRTAVVAYAAVPQLVPFKFVADIISEVPFSVFDPSTWIPTMKCPDVYEVFFNVLLTVPLGMFLRYFFKTPWYKALIIGFCTTLFFELSQLTGLWGLYAHPYRLFDVDDLMTNTLGAMVGYWLAGPLGKHLPDLDGLNERSVERALVFTSFTRRFVAFCIDLLIVGACYAVSVFFLPWLLDSAVASILLQAALTGFFFMVLPPLLGDATIGDRVLKLRIVRPDGSPAHGYRIFARYALLFWGFIMLPLWTYALLPDSVEGAALSADVCGLILVVMYGVWLASILVRAVRSALHHPFVMVNGMITDTRVMSVEQAEHLQRQIPDHAKPEVEGAASVGAGAAPSNGEPSTANGEQDARPSSPTGEQPMAGSAQHAAPR